VDEEAFLGGVAEPALVPYAVLEQAELLAEGAYVVGVGRREREIVGGPGVGGDFVFACAGIAAGFGLHFEEDEVVEAGAFEPPAGGESGDAASDDDEGHLAGVFDGRDADAIADEVAAVLGFEDEAALERAVSLEAEAKQRGRDLAAGEAQRTISLHSRS
jgi:hypothetical protein